MTKKYNYKHQKSDGKNDTGRPPKYNHPSEIQPIIDKYFEDCNINNEPYTITGLALSLRMDRGMLEDYARKKEFCHTIKQARTKVIAYAEKHLYSKHMVGALFHIKNLAPDYFKDRYEHTGKDGGPLVVKFNKTDEKL